MHPITEEASLRHPCMGSKGKGARGERELVQRLTEEGWWPMRAPTSGSATENDLPDVIAGKEGVTLAFEAKRAAAGTIYLKPEKIEALLRFAGAFGAIPLTAARFDRDTTWYVQNPVRLPETGSGNRKVKQAVAQEYPTLTELDQLAHRDTPQSSPSTE